MSDRTWIRWTFARQRQPKTSPVPSTKDLPVGSKTKAESYLRAQPVVRKTRFSIADAGGVSTSSIGATTAVVAAAAGSVMFRATMSVGGHREAWVVN